MTKFSPKDYYQAVFSSLEESFERSEYVLAYGRELITLMGFGIYDLPITVQPVSELKKLSVDWNLEVFLPIRGRDALLFPFDFEVALKNENVKLYAAPDSQKHYIEKYIFPVSDFLQKFFEKRKIPYLLDYTPSGAHLLFCVLRGTDAWRELSSIGRIEDDLRTAYQWTDSSGQDLKRLKPVSEEEGRVYNALGRIAEYIGLKIISSDLIEKKADGMEVHLCDASDRAVNIDISWAGDPLYYRIMRAPASLHRKNMNYYSISSFGPMADAKTFYYDTKSRVEALRDSKEECKDEILAVQWNLEKAADYNMRIPGYIPFANEGLAGLVKEYKKSPLYQHHIYFDSEEDLPRGKAGELALSDKRLSEKTRSIIEYPNPRMLQPEALRKMVRNFLESSWHPRHIGNVIRDSYINPEFEWRADWFKCPADTRSLFWARIYSSMYYLENNETVVTEE